MFRTNSPICDNDDDDDDVIMITLCVQDKQPDIWFISARLLPCKLSGFPLSYDDDDDDDDNDDDDDHDDDLDHDHDHDHGDGDGGSGGGVDGDYDDDLPCKLSGFFLSFHPLSATASNHQISTTTL